MKLFICMLFALIFSFNFICYATTTSKYGFRAISSSTSVTCGIFGMKQYSLSATPPQVFNPDPAYSRILNLGTKGMKNYSTNTKLGAFVIKYTCVQTGTNTPVSVKVFMNGVETYYLTLDQGIFGVNP